MVSDVLAVSLSLIAISMATRPSNSRYTFGYLRFEMIASFLNGLALCLISIWIFIEGMRRIYRPEPIDLPIMLTVAGIGLIVNLALTLALSRSIKNENNLNVRSALWHFIGDLLSSIGVIVSALLIWWTSFTWFDPLISLLIGIIIFIGGARITKEAYLVLMESVPAHFNLEEIRSDLLAIQGIKDVHEMHLWCISTDHYSLTAHIFIDDSNENFEIITAINELLQQKYGIEHSTIQSEHIDIHPHGDYGQLH
jgi:cobalt-zinc-cadmium efflux system protein